MAGKLRPFALTLVALLTSCAAPVDSQDAVAEQRSALVVSPIGVTKLRPTWHFTVVVRMPQSLSDQYGGAYAAYALVVDQLAAVNNRYNSSGAFRGDFSFDMAGFELFTDDPATEHAKAHPNADFALVYQETDHPAGGWRGDYQAILQSWCPESAPDACMGSYGVFSAEATDGLVHEFGHSRGAVDLYNVEVDADKNPFTRIAWTAPESVMTYPFGETIWDPYSVAIIDRSGGAVYAGSPVVDAAFPSSFTVQLLGRGEVPINGIHVDVFPVEWGSKAVTPTAILSGSSSTNKWTLPRNPFAPGSSNQPWNLRYPNFLVRARGGFGNAYVGYAFMPLTDVSNAAFATNNGPFMLTIHTF